MVTFNGIQVIVERKKQKGVSVSLAEDDSVVVNANEEYTDEEIQYVLDKHKRFFNNRIERKKERASAVYPDLNDGGTVNLLGKKYLVVRNSETIWAHIKSDKLYLPQNFSQWQATTFFGGLLFPYVDALTKIYMDDCWLECSKVGLNSRKTAWGVNFSSDNSIEYNRALVFVPEDCIEYVVVHELCHSLQPNHSKKFWEDVERILPNYKEADRKLGTYDLRRVLLCANLKSW